MARFLAPYKICVLVLTKAYLDAPVDASHTPVLLDIIATHLLPKTSPQHDGPSETAADFVRQLASLPSQVPGCTYRDEFVRVLWEAASLNGWNAASSKVPEVASLKGLHGLFAWLHAAITSTGVGGSARCSPGSPLGQFIRRSSIEWTRLPFDGQLSLMHAYRVYLEPTWDCLLRRHPDTARSFLRSQSEIVNSTTLLSTAQAGADRAGAMISAGDIQAALGQSIDFLQRRGTRVPAVLKGRLRDWLSRDYGQEQATQSLRHFNAFFEAWRTNQYGQALENLHRYFDYSIASRNAPDASDAAGNAKLYYQYALLHLSVLHADFEHWRESLNSMDECIATARENQDSDCLAFALSWSLYLRQAHPGGLTTPVQELALSQRGQQAHSELAFLKQKAKESKQWSLVSSTLLEEAKLELRSGGVTCKAFEYSYQAAHLNVQHGNTALMCADAVFLAGLYERLGQTHTASRHCVAVLAVLGERCNLRDFVRAHCRLAFASALHGMYHEAQELIDTSLAHATGTIKMEQRVKAFACLIALLKAVRRGDVEAASTYLSALRPMLSMGDPEFIHQMDLLEIDSAMWQRNFDSAFALVDSRLQTGAHEDGRGRSANPSNFDIAQHLQLLVVKASISAKHNHAEQALSIAVRAAAAAERLSLIPVLSEALLVLSKILVSLGDFKGANELAEAASARSLGTAGFSELSAGLFAVSMDAYVGVAGDHKRDTGSPFPITRAQAKFVRKGIASCERAQKAHTFLQDRCGQVSMLVAEMKLRDVLEDRSSMHLLEARLESLMHVAHSAGNG